MPRNLDISIVTGHFGSGKTEFAINYSLQLAKKGKKTVLVDLDIVNPFFRSTEVKKMLEEQGVEMICPNFATTNVDVPSLPASVYSAFEREDTHVIFDVGGDEDGARALGQYYPNFKDKDYHMYFVINTCRPFASDISEVVGLAKKIEAQSRLTLTDVVNNTNLSYETTIQNILTGQEKVEEIATILNLPVTYTCLEQKFIKELPERLRDSAFPIKRYMKPLWEE
ncbi:nucleotide-binding protein [Vallitalea okinawensis]|uniref:nucleotide-binding protein n=1 Tax=Vallitalea okinawensis TaxID=2078660 RepID=UPI000CFDC954|nr:ATP-binding protein [Vallitalea okinawensis]